MTESSGTFYVVTAASAYSDDYIAAVAFNSSHKDADNEAAANEYLAEVRASQPWHTHSIASEADFKTAADNKEPAVSDPADDKSDPANDNDEH